MKTILFILPLLAVNWLCFSCGEDVYSNPDQEEYVTRAGGFHKKYIQATNDIGKQEAYSEYQEWIKSYFFENDRLTDWEGEIRDIHITSSQTKGYTITCQIRVNNHNFSGRTTFFSSYVCRDADEVYESFKGLKNYDKVVFSGEVQKNHYAREILYENLKIEHPEIFLYITDISKH